MQKKYDQKQNHQTSCNGQFWKCLNKSNYAFTDHNGGYPV